MLNITRRQTLIGGGAIIAASTLKSRQSWAPPPPTNGVWATKLPGNSCFYNPGTLTGLPSNPVGTGLKSLCWRSTQSLANNALVGILQFGGGGGNYLDISFVKGQNPQGMYQTGIQISATDSTGQSTYYADFFIPDAFDGNWHGGIFSWDMANQWADSWIDGSPTTAVMSVVGTGQAVSYPNRPINVGGISSPGGTTPIVGSYTGDYADLVLFAGGAVVDPTNSDVVSAFFDLTAGLPTRKSASGILTAQGPLANLQANLILSGGVDMFGMNLPQQVPSLDAWTDPAPQGAFVPVGAVPTTSTEDPWGFS